MNDVLCDASVALKWFHAEGESGVEPARALLAAHADGQIGLAILDLTLYEIGNVLVRSLGWSATDAADQIDDLGELVPVLSPTSQELRRTAELAVELELTFYDAAYAAVASGRDAWLATADSKVVAAGAGETPGALVVRLGLLGTI